MLKLRLIDCKQRDVQDLDLIPSYTGQMSWLVGNNANCDLVLPDSDVDCLYGRIFYHKGLYHFVDLAGKTESLINGELIPVGSPRQLCEGDLLQVGRTLLYFKEFSAPSTVPERSFSSASEQNGLQEDSPNRSQEFSPLVLSHHPSQQFSNQFSHSSSHPSHSLSSRPSYSSSHPSHSSSHSLSHSSSHYLSHYPSHSSSHYPSRYPTFPTVNAYRAEAYPAFQEAMQAHFPGALPITAYMSKTYQCLSQYGFCDENTMAMVSSCRDEIADTLFVEVMRHWGKTFNCCSLAGFIMMGKTGLAAAVDHTPITNGTRRFIFYAMPHIAISEEGKLGKIHRSGIEKISRACGALDTIVKELEFSSPKLEMDMQDIEQTIIRQKVLSTINYGDKPNLVEITKLAAQIIFNDVDQLLNTLDQSVFKYAVMTGIQIHGPMDTHWIYPQAFYVAGSDVREGKETIALF